MSTELTLEEVVEITQQAFIYGFPLVENYGLMYGQAVQGAMGFNHILSSAKLYGPDDTDVVTPNNDTAYSQAWLNLAGGPVLLSVGPIPAVVDEDGNVVERYWSFQIIDVFTNNIRYIGLRATGPAESIQQFLFAGPDWQGSFPPDRVIRCPGQLVFLVGRTQLFDTEDIPNVEAIQATYVLSAPEVPPPSCIPYDPELEMTLQFFSYMNQCFAFQLPPASDADLMSDFANIGVGPGQSFQPDDFSEPVQQAMLQAMQDAMAYIKEASGNIGQIVEGWNMPQVDQEYFGTTPDAYVFRAAIAYKGIYANSPIEALYPLANLDAVDNQLTGADGNAYTIFFESGNMPPVQFFWSLTMYYLSTMYLVPNSIDRYSISNRTKDVQSGADGSLTFYLQYDPPAGEAVRNWLPAPDQPFYVVLRMYGPEGEALEGKYGSYKVPPLRRS